MIPEIVKREEGYERPSTTINIAGAWIRIFEMSLESFGRAMIVIEPFIGDAFQEFTRLDVFVKAAQGKKIDRVKAEAEVREAIRSKFGDLVTQVPRTAVQLIACIMNIPEEGEMTDFFWKEMSPDDLFSVIEKLDELNDFVKIGNRLLDLIRHLGKKYGVDISGEIVNKE